MQTIRSSVAFKPAAGRRALVVSNSAVAPAVAVPYKGTDGSDKGSKQVALKVAEETAKGLVHRYMVMVQQNARRVSCQSNCMGGMNGCLGSASHGCSLCVHTSCQGVGIGGVGQAVLRAYTA